MIEGMLKLPEGKGSFTPDNNPSGNEWYWMDLEAMSRVAGGEAGHVQPVIVDEIFGMSFCFALFSRIKAYACTDGKQVPGMLMAQGIPVGRPPVVELRNMHATYAATWYVYSSLSLVIATNPGVGQALAVVLDVDHVGQVDHEGSADASQESEIEASIGCAR